VFTNTLAQIGLGYFFLFLIGHLRPRWQWAALAAVLVGLWAGFALHEPDPRPAYQAVGLRAEWGHYRDGFEAHWDKYTNAGDAFDRWFLNLFPREKPFAHSSGGYVTLNAVGTLGTMILGLIAGGWLLRAGPPAGKFVLLLGTGLALLTAGLGLEAAGLCPIVKKIWTPTWVLYSGGWCFLFLAAFYALTDWTGYAGWTFPLRVVGANSILAYCLDGLARDFLLKSVRTHVGPGPLEAFGWEYEPLVTGAVALAVFWLFLYWLYRRRIFIRV
jgi:predicted acyltransferase